MKKLSTVQMNSCVGGLGLITGKLSPQGTNFVSAPPAAINGALVAFPHVLANTGGLANIQLVF